MRANNIAEVKHCVMIKAVGDRELLSKVSKFKSKMLEETDEMVIIPGFSYGSPDKQIFFVTLRAVSELTEYLEEVGLKVVFV